MITKNLTGKGETWSLNTAITVCAMNISAYLAMYGCSPFELVPGYKPPDLLNLTLPPLEQFTISQKDYTQLLKAKGRIYCRHLASLQNPTTTRWMT